MYSVLLMRVLAACRMPKAMVLRLAKAVSGASIQMPSPSPSIMGPPKSVAACNARRSSSRPFQVRRSTTGAGQSSASSASTVVRKSTMAWALSVSTTQITSRLIWPCASATRDFRAGWTWARFTRTQWTTPAWGSGRDVHSSAAFQRGWCRAGTVSSAIQAAASISTVKVPGNSNFKGRPWAYTTSHAASVRFHLSRGTL